MCESVPTRVRREVSAFLRCGDVRRGFVEVSCEDCQAARLVPLASQSKCKSIFVKEDGRVIASPFLVTTGGAKRPRFKRIVKRRPQIAGCLETQCLTS